jgi:hypothetical protein
MLQSARVHPFSSYLLVNRELHLEGHGFVVLRGIIFSSKMALIWALVSNGNKLEKKTEITTYPILTMIQPVYPVQMVKIDGMYLIE